MDLRLAPTQMQCLPPLSVRPSVSGWRGVNEYFQVELTRTES